MEAILKRLEALETENGELRRRLSQTETADLGAPSFHHTGESTGRSQKAGSETSFVEMEQTASGQSGVVEQEKEDPTIECQTVCKFVRPNSPSKLNAAQDQQNAVLQQVGAGEGSDE